MSIKSDKWILENVNLGNLGISPFVGESVNQLNGKKIPSYGLTSYGYDIRLGRNFKVARHSEMASPVRSFADYYVTAFKELDNQNSQLLTKINPCDDRYVDVCDFDEKFYVDINDVAEIVIPPHGFILGHSEEKIKIPRNISAVCMGKSTIARSGLIVIVTPLEPEWEGYVTLEIFNTLRMPIKLTAGIGILKSIL